MTSSGVRDAEPTVARSASADLNVLLLAANPLTTSRLDLEAETSAVERELNRDRVKFECRYAVSPDEMIRHVRRQNPSVLHFSGHGTRGGVVMRIDGSEALEVPGDALARFVQDRGISLVVLNCCYARTQVEELTSVVPAVVGTTDALQDAAAIRFSAMFYRALGDGLPVREALRDGRDAVRMYRLRDVFFGLGNLDIRFR
jgi:hypothetical protein